jgi:serine/threonine-protein kinase
MGIVVSARHITMGHRVAIKILNLDGDSDREDAIARFAREARAAARIESDHVVRVMDVAVLEDGTPFMVMEYLEGQDLKELVLERDQLPIAEAVGYVLEACEGLSEAHAVGVVHRDLKPGNLFLARKPNGRTLVKVLDFGISKVKPRAGEVAITTTSALMGSPMYMAPEQMQSSRDVDARADIWSLGLILYELLSGEVPFRGETIPEVCIAVMNRDPDPITLFRNDVPPGLQTILRKCMAKDRERRYQSMAALARDLVRFANPGAQVHAERASAALKASRAVTDPPPPLHSPPPLYRKPDVSPSSSTTDVGSTRVATPTLRRGPETIESWSTGRRSGKVPARTAWIALVAIVSTIAAGAIGAKIALAPSLGSTKGADVKVATEAAYTTTVAPKPPPTGDIPSVPFDSLPTAPAPDAGPARVVRAPAPVASPAPRAPTPPSASPSAASPSPAPPAKNKDDWKWGDRN